MSGICDTCHAGCCRAYHLVITAYDALVIARDLSLPIGEFTHFLATAADQINQFGDNTPIEFADAGLEMKRFFISLKKVASPLIPGTEKCFFLQEWMRQEPITVRGDHPGARIAGRCGIYHSRPQMCRTFPTCMHENGAVGFIPTPAPTPLQVDHEIYKVCPEKWTPDAFAKDPSDAMHTLALYRYERDFQNLAIADWNKKPGLAKDFFPFMMSVYGNRFRLGAELTATPPTWAPSAPPQPPL